MECKSSYPADYRQALQNVVTTNEIDNLLKRSGPPPFFIFGVLKLPSILKYIIDAGSDFDVVSKMVQATALDHRLYHIEGVDVPTIQATSELGQSVDGFLVFGLDAEQRGKIYQFESGSAKLDTIQVEICQRDGGVRTLDAGAFVWTGDQKELNTTSARSWKVDGFLKTDFYAQMVKSMDRNGNA